MDHLARLREVLENRPADDTLFVEQFEAELRFLWVDPAATPAPWWTIYTVFEDAFADLEVTSAIHHRLTRLLLRTLVAADTPQLTALQQEVTATPPLQWLAQFRELTADRLAHLGEEQHTRPAFQACAQQLVAELQRLDQLLDFLRVLPADGPSLSTLVDLLPMVPPTNVPAYWRAAPQHLYRAQQFVRWQLVVLHNQGYPLSALETIYGNYLAVHALGGTRMLEDTPLTLPTGAPLEVALAQLYYQIDDRVQPLEASSITAFTNALVPLLAQYNTFDTAFATPFLILLGRLLWGLPKEDEEVNINFTDPHHFPSFQNVLTYEVSTSSEGSVRDFISKCAFYTRDRLQYLAEEGWTAAEFEQRRCELTLHADLLNRILQCLPNFEVNDTPIHDATQHARAQLAAAPAVPAAPYIPTRSRSFDLAHHWLACEVQRIEEEYALFLHHNSHVGIATLAETTHVLCDGADGGPVLLSLSVLEPVFLQLARLEIARYRYVTDRE
jgi:hypothetical protein